tara:strand:- start:2484 stop:3740 length:1257 start_codon:yes stop_codon:yes gene_type:complete
MKNIKKIVESIGIKAKKASFELSKSKEKIRNNALKEAIKLIDKSSKEIINVNKKDLKQAHNKKLSDAIIDRLLLNQKRIDNIIFSLQEIIKIENPLGKVISDWYRPNGLYIKKISVPIGVIGIVYESRPNVTVDASAIAIKSGNAVILRGGKDSFYTSKKLFDILKIAFNKSGIPKNSVQMIPVIDRLAVNEMLKLEAYIDLIIPRGSQSLIKTVKKISSIPMIKHLDGICHVYIDGDANLEIAKKVLFNSKMRRPGICGAAETLLIDKKLSKDFLYILKDLKDVNCEIRGDNIIKNLDSKFKLAKEKDWSTEYLDKIISVKIVNGVSEAIRHINKYSSNHTETIITENKEAFIKFKENVDSAIILKNASTQFADGGEFGFGSEIGISTDKLHVRGPVGTQHLTSYKYVVEGNGQIRS